PPEQPAHGARRRCLHRVRPRFAPQWSRFGRGYRARDGAFARGDRRARSRNARRRPLPLGLPKRIVRTWSYPIGSVGLVTFDHDAVHAPPPSVVGDGVMLHEPIVPERHRTGPPLEPALEHRISYVIEEVR